MTKVRFLRGAVNDLTFTPEVGEPAWADDTGEDGSRLFVGNGSSTKGVQVGWPFAPNPGWKANWYYSVAPPISAYVTVVATANFVVYSPIFIGGGVRDVEGAREVFEEVDK